MNIISVNRGRVICENNNIINITNVMVFKNKKLLKSFHIPIDYSLCDTVKLIKCECKNFKDSIKIVCDRTGLSEVLYDALRGIFSTSELCGRYFNLESKILRKLIMDSGLSKLFVRLKDHEIDDEASLIEIDKIIDEFKEFKIREVPTGEVEVYNSLTQNGRAYCLLQALPFLDLDR